MNKNISPTFQCTHTIIHTKDISCPHETDRCDKAATAEDMLCDGCRVYEMYRKGEISASQYDESIFSDFPA